MNRRTFLEASAKLAAVSALTARLSPLLHAGEAATAFTSTWDRFHDRIWLGAEYWSNPLQDWRLARGRIECTNPAVDRNVHLLTRQLANRTGTLDMQVRIGRPGGETLAGKGSAGFRIGILGTLKDYPELAGTPKVFESTMNRDAMIRYAQMAKEQGIEVEGRGDDEDWDPGAPADDGNPFGTPESELSIAVDVRDFVDVKRSSIACHKSQISDSSFFLSMPDEAFNFAFGTEWFIEPGSDAPLRDGWLFE